MTNTSILTTATGLLAEDEVLWLATPPIDSEDGPSVFLLFTNLRVIMAQYPPPLVLRSIPRTAVSAVATTEDDERWEVALAINVGGETDELTAHFTKGGQNDHVFINKLVSLITTGRLPR